jgi:lactoylglutathione lyase
MRIEHVALWTLDLDRMKDFYIRYFDGQQNGKYRNANTGFESYFLSFRSGARLELMTRTELGAKQEGLSLGYAHLAFSLGTQEAVRQLTEKLRSEGYIVVSEPRTTGDGYYESVIQDPEGNLVEITV